jgi:hypothetical protein
MARKSTDKTAGTGCRSDADRAETSVYVEGLRVRGRLQRKGEKLKPGATHVIESDAKGEERVVRRRFSAVKSSE